MTQSGTTPPMVHFNCKHTTECFSSNVFERLKFVLEVIRILDTVQIFIIRTPT